MPEDGATGSSRDQIPELSAIQEYAERLNLIDKLCLLGGSTLAWSRIEEGGKDLLLPNIRLLMLATDNDNRHPTTAAQCLVAAQRLARSIDELTSAKKESAQVPNVSLSLASVDKKVLKKQLSAVSDKWLRDLTNVEERKNNLSLIESTEFGQLNPLTAAHVFRSLTEGEKLAVPAWYHALFALVWAISRERPLVESDVGASIKDCTPNAFVTSECFGAILGSLRKLERRHARLVKLKDVVASIEGFYRRILWLRKNPHVAGILGVSELVRHRAYARVVEARGLLSEMAYDAAFSAPFESAAEQAESFLETGIDGENLEGFSNRLNSLLDKFAEAIGGGLGEGSQGSVPSSLSEVVVTLSEIREAVSREQVPEGEIGEWRKNLPDWLTARENGHWTAVQSRNEKFSADAQVAIQGYWESLSVAAAQAMRVCDAFAEFLNKINDSYMSCAGYTYPKDLDAARTELESAVQDAASAREASASARADHGQSASEACTVSAALARASGDLGDFAKKAWAALRPAERCADKVLDRQLAYWNSGSSRFDVSELAHALKIIVRSTPRHDSSHILRALQILCEAQLPDGSWPRSLPFYWRRNGIAVHPQSVGVAAAVMTIVSELAKRPDQFGLSAAAVHAVSQTAHRGLDRYVDRLAVSAKRFPWPELSGKAEGRPHLVFGWSADTVNEPELVHTWATASILEFLLDLREEWQEAINGALRRYFISYDGAELLPLAGADPTDLGEPDIRRRQSTKFANLAIEHRLLEYPGHRATDAASSVVRSMIFHGPPGSAKTFTAECLAHETGWPLIVLTPSDFVSQGQELVEARSREIFEALACARRVIIFFDEIDELIRSRTDNQSAGRNIFSFVTPSFLTKLQDLRKVSKDRSLVFIIATNYEDRIDDAAKRTGRIDEKIAILYPDHKSRGALILGLLEKEALSGWTGKDPRFDVLERIKGDEKFVERLSGATHCFSYNTLKDVCKTLKKDGELAKLMQATDKLKLDQLVREIRKRDIDPEKFYERRPNAKDEKKRIGDLASPKNAGWGAASGSS
jgi:hypothetical protein